MQAAESRIRDADMAEEMVHFTRDSILLQSATAMLAQANLKPRSVLQLLT
jgi:flagellin